MKQYTVSGMSCAACSARVEQAVNAVEGVTACSVSLLTNSMGVEGTASDKAIIDAVTAAGYGAAVKGAQQKTPQEDALRDTETPKLRRRLLWSLGFLIVLMYGSMGHMMWGWPLPRFFDGNHVAKGLAQLLLAAIIMVINQKFFISGVRSLWHRAPNMDALVALGSASAFLYSTYALFEMTAAQTAGDSMQVMSWLDDLYFESAATILTLITVGKMLEARSKGKTTDALKSLMNLSPKTARKVVNGEEKLVPVEEVQKGDILAVRPGEHIPVDAVILEGESAVDESALSGESIPVDKTAGDSVFAGTVNQAGFIRCEASRVGEDTTLSQIIRMVSDAAATKAPIAKIADKVSGVFVPAVMAIAAVTVLVWLLLGESVGFALSRGIAVLVISCPCSLGLATPVAIMVGNGVGAKNGILFKTASALENTGKTQIVVLDKTGTVTAGKPQVTDIVPAEGEDEASLLRLAAALEAKSEHPLANAVREYAQAQGVEIQELTEFSALPGNGLRGLCDGKTLLGGSMKFISSLCTISSTLRQKAEQLSDAGKTPLFFAKDGQVCGMIAVADVIKEDSREAIAQLKEMGIRVWMLTGDNKRTAEAIGAQVGVDRIIAGVLPDGKERVVRQLSEQVRVAMVGDGINDAPALTRAQIGIAIGAGADIAIDAAEVVLMRSRLTDVPAAIRLSRAALRNIHENLFWAFFYNSVGIPVAAGVFWALGWKLNPMLAAACMSLSSFCVVSNALRLNFFRLYDAKHDRKLAGREMPEINIEIKEENAMMVRTMKIEGMMCPHCEARVRKALEAVEGVESAVVSHVSGTATVTCSNVSDDALKAAVEKAEYPVLGIE